MENKSSLVPFVTLILGFLIYVAADQGVFSFSSPGVSSEAENKTETEKSDLSAKEVQKELKEVKLFVKETKGKLKKIMSSLDRIDLEVDRESNRLRKLLKNFGRIQRSLASTSQGQKMNTIDQTPVTNWSEFIDLAKKVSKHTEIHPVSYGEDPALQIVSDRLWKSETLYLLPRGIRLSQVLSRYAKDLGAKTISIAFERDNLSAAGRAEVLAGFLKDLSPSNLEIVTKESDSDLIHSSQGLDILIALNNK
jgi:hypothetical protein